MSYLFCISIIMIVSSVLTIIIGMIEYFTLKKITKSEVVEYKSTLKTAMIILIIGIIAIAIYIHIEGIPQLIGW